MIQIAVFYEFLALHRCFLWKCQTYLKCRNSHTKKMLWKLHSYEIAGVMQILLEKVAHINCLARLSQIIKVVLMQCSTNTEEVVIAGFFVMAPDSEKAKELICFYFEWQEKQETKIFQPVRPCCTTNQS